MASSAFALLWGFVALATVPVTARNSDVVQSGQPGYWVQLRALSPNVGSLEPAFTPDASHYKLWLKSTRLDELRLNLVLNRDRYVSDFPDIFVDGKPLEYDPLTEPQISLRLNRNIGAYDKMLTIRLADPHALQGWFGYDQHTHFDYKIHIMQPPEFESVIQSTGIAVRGADGAVLQPDGDFHPSRTDYHFSLAEEDTSVDVQANCSQYATDMAYNGKPAKSGSRLPVEIPGADRKVLIQCIYSDPKWSKNRYALTYQLHFTRNVTVSDKTVQMSLKMMPHHGYCVAKAITKSANGTNKSGANVSNIVFASKKRTLLTSWTEAQTDPPGDFVCRTQSNVAQLVPLFHGVPGARISIRRESDGNIDYLTNGLPHTVDVPELGRQLYTLLVTVGEKVKEYSVSMVRPSICESLECPTEKVLKAEAVSNTSSAWSRLCLEEACTEVDVPHCCMNRASCGTFGFECPAHQILRHDAVEVLCKGAECTEDEVSVCCEPQSVCSTFDLGCGDSRVLADKADSIYCEAEKCTEQDSDACCQDRAGCSSFDFGCAADLSLRTDGALCKGTNCTKADEHICCEPKATCEDFSFGWECPEGQAVVQPPNKTLCSSGSCSAEDNSTCCVPRAPCSSLTCPAHSLPKADSFQELCKYAECDLHHDLSRCCDEQASCDSSMTDWDCPAGQFLILDANETFCAGANCTEEEKAACCKAAASCSEFHYDCPVGYMHRLSSTKAHCRTPKCTEDDSELCCREIPGVEGLKKHKHLSAIKNDNVLDYLQKKPEAIRQISGSWITGLESRDCHSTCEAHGLVCTEAGLYAHNDEVDSEKEVIKLMKESHRLDVVNYDGDCSDIYGNEPDIPQFWSEGCFRSAKDRPLSTFNCSTVPVEEEGQMKHRLCYCHEVVTSINDLRSSPRIDEDEVEEVDEERPHDARPLSPEDELEMADADMTKEIFEFLGGLILNHDCWHVDAEQWSSTKMMWCSQHYNIHVAAVAKKTDKTSHSRYTKRSLLRDEGSSVGDFSVSTLTECMRKCDETPDCNSFSFSADAGLARNGCNLKDKVASRDDKSSGDIAKGDYMSYIKVGAASSSSEFAAEDAQRLDSVSGQMVSRLRAPNSLSAKAPTLAAVAVAAAAALLVLAALAVRAHPSVSARIAVAPGRFERLPDPAAIQPSMPLVAPDVE